MTSPDMQSKSQKPRKLTSPTGDNMKYDRFKNVKKVAQGAGNLAGKAIGKMRDGGTPGRVKSTKAPSLKGGAFTSKFSR